jgi:hypothetical protein
MGDVGMVSDSAQALFLSLITHQVTPWQSVCHSPAVAEHGAKEVSALRRAATDVVVLSWTGAGRSPQKEFTQLDGRAGQ